MPSQPLRKTEEEISSLAKLVVDNYEDEEVKTQFLSLAIQLLVHPEVTCRVWIDRVYRVHEQPFKIPYIAAIIIVINSQKPNATEQILSKAVVAIQEHLEAGAWREVKLVLRLLGCLQGILEEDGVFPILDEFFSRAVDLQTASSEDVSTMAEGWQ